MNSRPNQLGGLAPWSYHPVGSFAQVQDKFIREHSYLSDNEMTDEHTDTASDTMTKSTYPITPSRMKMIPPSMIQWNNNHVVDADEDEDSATRSWRRTN